MTLRRLDSLLSLQPHQNSAPTGHIHAFSEMLPLSGKPFSGYQGTFLIRTPSGMEATQFSKMKSTEIALHFIFIILNMLQNTVAPEESEKQTFLLQAVGAQTCQESAQFKGSFHSYCPKNICFS